MTHTLHRTKHRARAEKAGRSAPGQPAVGAEQRMAATPNGQQSVGVLVKQASEQLSELVRSELRLAQAEMTSKGKRLGLGGGLFGGAGLLALLGLQALVATVIAAFAVAIPVWAAALILTGMLFFVAAVLALLGRWVTRRATPLKPEQAISGVRADVEEIRERAHR
ncbi:phage holin family protein [Streptomyces sp. KR80]|uniref:phage holin family protein n=1 Tax=Streptomyces sp. KR80 TaxID=3457426 RepID=UPI003FD46684